MFIRLALPCFQPLSRFILAAIRGEAAIAVHRHTPFVTAAAAIAAAFCASSFCHSGPALSMFAAGSWLQPAPWCYLTRRSCPC